MAPFRSLPLQSLSIFLGSFVGPLVLYKYATWLSYPVLSVCIMVYGFVLGSASSIAFDRKGIVCAALAATAGILLLWFPVVLVTYGFALMAVPFLVAYAGCVAAGKLITTTVRRGHVR